MIFKQLNRLQQVDQLIRQKRTGNASELANKLGISRRQVYNFMEELKELGLEPEYNRVAQSFIYCNSHRVHISFGLKDLTSSEERNIFAGIRFLRKKMFVQINCTNARYL